MADSDDVIIQIRAEIAQAKAQLDKLTGDLNGLRAGGENAADGMTKLKDSVNENTAAGKRMSTTFTELRSGLSLLSEGLQMAGQAYEQTVQKAVDYNKTIKDFSRNIGASVEDTSRIVQVADDYEISIGQMQTALQLAVKNGFEPSIENLAALADEYNSISDPIQQAAILTEKFGRNWAVITPMLAAGGDAIRAQSAAISDGLIVTEEAVRKSEEYRLTVDNLSDAWQGFTMQIGQATIPALTKLIDVIDGGKNASEAAAGFIDTVFKGTFLESNYSKMIRSAVAAGQGVGMDMQETLRGGGKIDFTETIASEIDLAASTERAKEKMSDLSLFMSGPVGKANKDYIQTSEKLKKELKEQAAIIDDLKSKPWLKDELKQAEEQYENINAQINNNAAMQSRASKQMIWDMSQQLMAQDGLTEAEADAQIALAEKFGLIDKETKGMWDSLKKPVSEMAAGKTTAEEWLTTMQMLASRWDITVVWNYEDPPAGSTTTVNRVNGKNNKAATPTASGIDYVVPPGYEGDTWPVLAKSGERVQVTPPGKPGYDANTSGGITIYGRTTIVNGQAQSTNRRAILRSARVKA